MDNLHPLDHEKYLIKLLLTEPEARDKIYSFVSPIYFDEEFSHNKIIELYQSYRDKYNSFPSPSELMQMCNNEVVFNAIKDVIAYDTSDFKQEFLEEETAEFFKKKMLMTNIFSVVDILKRDDDTSKLNDFPDKLREALAFSFDTRVGLDFFEDTSRLYDSLHAHDKVISTGLRDIDKLIKGGIHEKTLTMVIAGCVTKDTKVKIRYTNHINSTETVVDISEVEHLLLNNIVEVSSPDGWVEVTAYVEKAPKPIYEVLAGDIRLKCSNDHLILTDSGWMKTEDLLEYSGKVLTNHGWSEHNTTSLGYNEAVIDLAVDHENHRYYTGGICSHNTNVGKTVVKCAVAANMIRQNKNVLYVTFEMSEEKISERILANLLDVEIDSLTSIKKDQFMRRMADIKNNIKGKLVVKEYPTSGGNTNTIRALLKELKVKKNFVPDIIFVDYLGIMLANSKADGANTNTLYKMISQDLRGLAVETGIPVVTSNQTNRGGINTSDFELTEVADSIGQTMTADIIIGITQTEELAQSNLYSFKMLKNRYGGRFGRALVGVEFARMRLYDVDQESGASDEQTRPSQSDVDAASGLIDTAVRNDKNARRNKVITFE